ncbi:acyl-CoA dehydrogenase family protein [uncultured Jatrophihabitans sp.]|uniref:acyl-CoA dehydrogenase family protein n=1 Tax=uncultured Jatrophihabitans sp. TaxID=1610747 RepID=UPI0035C9B330
MTLTAEPRQVHDVPVPDLTEDALARVTAEIAEHAAEYDRTGEIPWKSLEVLHRAGLTTATVGTQYGGPGLGQRDVARIVSAVGQGDPSVALFLANTVMTHAAQAAVGGWYDVHYDDLLRRSLERPTFVNAVRAEPELGAPARGGIPATTITRTSDGWLLNGHKAYGTGGRGLAYQTVWVSAVEPDGDPERPRVGHISTPNDLPGITWLDTWDHIGLRASNTHDVRYDNVELPYEAFREIPRQADGSYRDPAAAAGPGGFAHVALYIGVARAARADFRAFTRGRVPTALGKPIAETERIQSVAGEIDLQIATAETLLHGSLLRLEQGDQSILPQLSVIKIAIGRAVVAATQIAVAALGNPGLTRHNALERHLRNALCVRVHPPQEDAALLAAGKRVLADTAETSRA